MASWVAPDTPNCPQVPLVIKALQRQLKDRSIRARQGCFSLLTELAGVLPGSLAGYMPVLMSGRLGGPPCLPLASSKALSWWLQPRGEPGPQSQAEPLFSSSRARGAENVPGLTCCFLESSLALGP